MAISIDTVYQRVLALANKEQRGYITPQEFNLFADQAQMEIFEQYFYDINQWNRQHGNDHEYSDMLVNLEEKIDKFAAATDSDNVTVLNQWGDVNLENIRSAFQQRNIKSPEITTFGSNDEILINTGEKIKVTTSDGNVMIGMYYKVSISKKEIIVSGKKNSKIYYEDIKEISRGLGNKSVEYGTTGATLGCIGGFVLGNIIFNDDAYRGVMGAIFGIGGGIGGLVGGLSTGFKTPIDFEEPILINNNEWEIVN